MLDESFNKSSTSGILISFSLNPFHSNRTIPILSTGLAVPSNPSYSISVRRKRQVFQACILYLLSMICVLTCCLVPVRVGGGFLGPRVVFL